MNKKVSKQKISLFFLIMVSSAFVTSIRNLPAIAEMQMQMIFFAGIAAICYFIPAALTSAELASGWPKMGGIYVWAREAFGKRVGFFAVWMQWTYMVISIVAMAYFISGSLAYVINPALSNHRLFLVAASLTIIWLFTILNLKGLRLSSIVSTIGFLSGVLFPALLIIALGFIYLFMGNPIQLNLTPVAGNYFPDFKEISTFVLLVAFMRAFAGIEASASHASNVENPQRNYPIAIFIVVLIGIFVNVMGSLSVAAVVPQKEISLVAGVMEAFEVFFAKFHMSWLVPLLAFLVAIGQMGGVSTWLIGPSKGLLATSQDGLLPHFFTKVNKKGMPTRLLIMQAIIISLIATLLMTLTTINLAFWFSVALSVMVYVTMYFMMFLSGIALRFSQPKVKRAYKIPGRRNLGMWIVAGIGMLTMVFAFSVAFIPPKAFPLQNHAIYTWSLVGGIIVIYFIPILISHVKSRGKGK